MLDVTVEQALELAQSSFNAGDFAQAESLVRQILAQVPNQPEALHLLGLLAVQCDRHAMAIEFFQQAVAIQPAKPLFFNSLGNIFKITRQYDRAIEAYRKALQLDPNYALALGNLGFALYDRGNIAEALETYEAALKLDPNFADVRLNYAIALLLSGNFQQGWQEYEWRWKSRELPSPIRNFTQPLWTGQDLTGKILFLHAEQGFGDAIQFARYIPLVAQRKPKQILVECHAELESLFQSIPDITLFPRESFIPKFDLHCPFMTLPLAFNTTLDTIPNIVPYLAAPPDRVNHFKNLLARTATSSGTRPPLIGLVWAGRPTHGEDRYRSLPLTALAPLFQIPNLSFVSLQKGPANDQIATSGLPILNLSEHMKDFADTAALIAHLDLVITVDTSVAHLAGALAKPVWLLLHSAPDWRWLLNRPDSPWYPTMKIFRQSPSAPNTWSTVIEQITQELRNLKPKR